MTKPIYSVSVRELVEFVWRRGDLGGNRDFVGRNRALRGTRGHQKIQRARPSEYEKEIAVSQDIEVDEFVLRIRGRIDGLLRNSDGVFLEEIKTIEGIWDKTADDLHWAQAKIYGGIFAQANGLKELIIQLTYLELETEEIVQFTAKYSATDLSLYFDETISVYLGWMRERHEFRQRRSESIRALEFPFQNYRLGQREMAVAVYRALTKGGRIFLEAPTGIGKTMSVIFPAVKAMGEEKIDRVFYLTARTIGRTVAEKAFADLRAAGLHFSIVTLTAKEKICVRDNKPCDITSCPFAQGYFERHKPAMREALARQEMNRDTLEEIGAKHRVCPFELSLDVSTWADAVICDYNYVFDPSVYLRRHFDAGTGNFAFLIDEAHNLVDRAREIFSADLEREEIFELKRAIQKTVPRCAKAMGKLGSGMRELFLHKTYSNQPATFGETKDELNFSVSSKTATPFAPGSRQKKEAIAQREFHQELLPLVEKVMKEAELWLVKNEPADFRENLLSLYFRLNAFQRTAELYDEHFVSIMEASGCLRLFCLDPSALLRNALERGRVAVFFSATLTPLDYYRTLLGGSAEDPSLKLPSPFPSENLAVLVQDRIQTQFKARETSIHAVVDSIHAFVQGRRGNYIVYFPSYQYLNQVYEEFQRCFPAIFTLPQRPRLTETERDNFLSAFKIEHGETLVGFAVMGGIFGEGIDLVGERLIGAVIIGVGLPQLCLERDLIRDYFQEKNGMGFDYSYTFPGMNRVLQAVGRVIRSETDRGMVLLIDTRFSQSRYRQLFPKWWNVQLVKTAAEIQTAGEQFFKPLEKNCPELGTQQMQTHRDGGDLF